MIHPLDGARLKVIRAQEHVDALNAEIGMYLRQDPYRFVPYDNGQPGGTLEVHTPPPLRLSTLIGDCVTNARAALDYTAWEVTTKFLQDPPFNPDDDTIWIKFPILTPSTKAGYTNHINRLTNRKVPTDALDRIQSVQPHNAGYESIGILHALVNRDKHRMPVLTIGLIDTLTVNFKDPHRTDFAVRVLDESGSDIAAIWGENVTTLTTPPFDVHTDRITFRTNTVQMNAQPSIFVTFQDVAMPREPIDVTLAKIVKTVADVIPRFDSFF